MLVDGENYEFEYVCTNCEQKNVEAINLNEIKHFDVDFQKISEDGGIVITLPMTKAVVKAKVLAGRDDIEVQKRIKQKKKHNVHHERILF